MPLVGDPAFHQHGDNEKQVNKDFCYDAGVGYYTSILPSWRISSMPYFKNQQELS